MNLRVQDPQNLILLEIKILILYQIILMLMG